MEFWERGFNGVQVRTYPGREVFEVETHSVEGSEMQQDMGIGDARSAQRFRQNQARASDSLCISEFVFQMESYDSL